MVLGDARASCPTGAELEAFAIGDLSTLVLERVAGHVTGCERCAAALRSLDVAADGLVADLRGLDAQGNGADEAVPAPLVERARAAYTADVVVDPGREFAHALQQGPVRVGRFELLEELGAGSFGYVFKANDTELDRTVAVKVERAGRLGRPEEHERFLREARSTAQLDHPGIVSLYETGATGEGVRYLVSEFVAGETLDARLARGRVPLREAVRFAAEIADALHYAHERGVVHRDVKPSNIIVDAAGRPHVLDLGLAKRDTDEETVTVDGAIMGTPGYMSPELARGDSHHVDARSDVFSLGVVLYEMVTGERPFQASGRMLLLQVLEDEPRPPRRLDDSVPKDLETICLKALAKARAKRYATMGAFRDDLRRFERGDPIHARPMGRAERFGRWCRKNPVAASFLAAVTLGSALGFWHLSRLSGELVRSSAYDSAAQYAGMLEVVNAYYSTEVVARLGHHEVQATADYARRADAIPLPATALTELLERIGEHGSGMQGSHYSAHPFRSRPDGGPKDRFQKDALERLRERPDEPFYEFAEDYGGRPALRFATARVMKESCVACHNTHPDSTKRDWKVGDVRGVLEVVRPLDRDRARIRAGLRGTFVLVAVASGLFLLLTVGALVAADRRRR